MKSIKCLKCGLANWSTTETCKGCGAALASLSVSVPHPPAQKSALLQMGNPQFTYHPPPPPEPETGSLVSLGVLMILLGSLLIGVSFYFLAHSAKWPLYFPILGFSFIASGVIFCLREWLGVYVYLTGLSVAATVMFVTEDVEKPWVRLAVPSLIGLLMINKMIKWKKSVAAYYRAVR